MKNLLKEVTYKTIKTFKAQDIVLPGDYSQQFSLHAKECDLDLEEEDIVLKSLFQDKDELVNITNETSSNLRSLHQTTSNAKLAIENKNASALLIVHKEIVAMQKKIESLQEQLCTDTLTKAKNRKWFLDYYLFDEKFIDDGYLVFIDLNNFKYVNDTYGHIMGDMVLKYLSTYLQDEIKGHNTSLVRYAGDEFMIVFNNHLPKDRLINFLDKIQEKLAKRKLKSKITDTLQFSYSYGITSFVKEDTFTDILEIADARMYENKQKMKNKEYLEKFN